MVAAAVVVALCVCVYAQTLCQPRLQIIHYSVLLALFSRIVRIQNDIKCDVRGVSFTIHLFMCIWRCICSGLLVILYILNDFNIRVVVGVGFFNVRQNGQNVVGFMTNSCVIKIYIN